MELKISLYKINPVSGGEETELYTEISNEDNLERNKFIVSAEMFFELGLSLNAELPIDISREKYDEIIDLSEKNSAIKKGIYILSFSDNTKKGLAKKLVSKGFSRHSAEYASYFLAEAGYINEESSAELLARDMAEKKLYGPKRIAVALCEKGFSKEAIDKVSNEFFVDFSAICRKRIEKMGGLSIFSDKDEKKKAVAALLRYGFSYDDIKDAIKKKL